MQPLTFTAALLLLAACHSGPPAPDPQLLAAAERTVRLNTTTFVTDGALATGVYFVVDSGYGYPRVGVDYSHRPGADLGNGYSTLYIDPTPIVTPAHFTRIVNDDAIAGTRFVLVELDPLGAARWQVAMRLAVDKQIAIVVGDTVMSNPIAIIDEPVWRASLNLGNASDGEVDAFVHVLNAEKGTR